MAFAARSRRAWSAWELDRLDIVYLHDPDDHWSDVLATGYAALEELRAAGMVGAIGAGMNQSQMLARLVRETDVDVVMLAGRYTLLEQDALDDLLPLCCERRVAVVAAGVFNSGLLARAHPADDAKYDYDDAPRELVERAQAIRRITVSSSHVGERTRWRKHATKNSGSSDDAHHVLVDPLASNFSCILSLKFMEPPGRTPLAPGSANVQRGARQVHTRSAARACVRHGTTLPGAALAFPLAHPAVASVCVGARSAAQMRRNAALYGEAIAPDLWSELKAEGLLRDDAPVPR